MWDYAEKTVVVVGGTSGINRGIAESFARAGARVAVASRSQEKVNDTVDALTHLGADSWGFSADVRDAEAIALGLEQVFSRWGAIDVLVSGAAGNFPALATQMSAKGFRSVVEIDLLGSFHVLQAAYPYLRKPGASIVNISAPQAYLAMQGQSHVCAAKAGVDMLTRSLALEWGGEGLRVNSVAPGPIDGTEGMRRLAPSAALRERVTDSVPLRRLGTPDDIGNACLFLCSEFASYISGVVLPVDGAWSLSGARGISDLLSTVLRENASKPSTS